MKITFIPDSDLQDFSQAVIEYQAIWDQKGDKIVSVWESVTGLTFQESEINAIVFVGYPSHSHPLAMRADLASERRESVLVHELGHRLLFQRMVLEEKNSLENHKVLFLVLHEIFEKLFGPEKTKEIIEWDKNLPRPEYKQAWEWALSFSKEERLSEFKKRIR